MNIPEPIERPLSSLIIPGQKEAVKKFLDGSAHEEFFYDGKKVIIEEDGGGFVIGRAPTVTLIDEEIRYTGCIQDRQTHIAQRINNALAGKDGNGYGGVVRDTVEAISGIPPFETARLWYLILFLIKRGYVPVGSLLGRGIGASNLLYKAGLVHDKSLEVRELWQIISGLWELYGRFQNLRVGPEYPRKALELARLKNHQTRYHMRLQYKPEIAWELYEYIKTWKWNVLKTIRKIKKNAYK